MATRPSMSRPTHGATGTLFLSRQREGHGVSPAFSSSAHVEQLGYPTCPNYVRLQQLTDIVSLQTGSSTLVCITPTLFP